MNYKIQNRHSAGGPTKHKCIAHRYPNPQMTLHSDMVTWIVILHQNINQNWKLPNVKLDWIWPITFMGDFSLNAPSNWPELEIVSNSHVIFLIQLSQNVDQNWKMAKSQVGSNIAENNSKLSTKVLFSPI